GLRAEICGWLEDWQELLEGEPAPARQLLRKLFVGRLVWTPRADATGGWYDYAVDTSYGRLLAGVGGVKGMVPPGWIEHPGQGLGNDGAPCDSPSSTRRFAALFLGIRAMSTWPSRGQCGAELGPFHGQISYS